jgi:hypothetical protein
MECADVREARPASLEQRVVRAAGAALAEQKFVAAIDVLVGLGCCRRHALMSGGKGASTGVAFLLLRVDRLA